MSDLFAFEKWVGAVLLNLSPQERRKMGLTIARELRRSEQQRVTRQENPDGSAFAPRKRAAQTGGKRFREKKGRIKREAMFVKLKTTKYLGIEADALGLAVGFNARVSRIARVHQEGQRARVAPKGPEVKYPARALLGITAESRALIADLVLKHITP